MTSLLRTRTGALGAALVVALVALAVAGCGSQPAGDIAAGKQIFQQSCASCHTLADAGSTAEVGPNLDDAFRAARQVGMEDVQFQGVVRRWIEIAQPPMPRNIVTGKDADNVAAYIASVAGRSAQSTVRKAPAPTPEVVTPARRLQD